VSEPGSIPQPGDLAPDFKLPSTPEGEEVTLSSFKGRKHVLLAFYVFDFSPT
jgi:peroxiredoxin